MELQRMKFEEGIRNQKHLLTHDVLPQIIWIIRLDLIIGT